MVPTTAVIFSAPKAADTMDAVHAHAQRSVISRPSSPHTDSASTARMMSSDGEEPVLGSRHSAPAANSYAVSSVSKHELALTEHSSTAAPAEVSKDAATKPATSIAVNGTTGSSSSVLTATVLPPPALALVSSALLASGGGPPAASPAAGITNGSAAGAGNTPEAAALTSAVAASKLGLVDQLRAAVGSHENLVNSRDGEGRTCLHYAAGYGNEECVDLLLSKSADTSAQDCNGDVPLHFAAIHGHPMCAYNIGKAGCGACLIKNSRNQTPVDVAVACERGEVLNAMLLACAGNTGEVAVRAMRTLLKDGAVPDTWAPNGSSALMLAASVDATQALQVLLEAGASIELQDALGRSALMFAAGNCAHSALVALLDAGACMSLRDRRGRSVLDYAPENSKVRMTLQARLSALEAVARQRQHDLLASLTMDTPASVGSKQGAGGSSNGRGSSKTSSKELSASGSSAKKSKASRKSASGASAATADSSLAPVPTDKTVSGHATSNAPAAEASEADLVCTVEAAPHQLQQQAGSNSPCICSHSFECDSDIGSCLLSGEDGDPTGWQVVEHKGHTKRQAQVAGSTTTHSQLHSRCHSNISLASTITSSAQGAGAASPRLASAGTGASILRPVAGEASTDSNRGRHSCNSSNLHGSGALRAASPAGSTRSHASNMAPRAAGMGDTRRPAGAWGNDRAAGCPAVTAGDSMVRQGSGHSLSSLGSCDSHPYSHTSSSSYGTASMRHSHMSGASFVSHVSHLATIPSNARLAGMDGCFSPSTSSPSQQHTPAQNSARTSPSAEAVAVTALAQHEQQTPAAAAEHTSATTDVGSGPAAPAAVSTAAAPNAWASRKPLILPPAAPQSRPAARSTAATSVACTASCVAGVAADAASSPAASAPRSWATIANGQQAVAHHSPPAAVGAAPAVTKGSPVADKTVAPPPPPPPPPATAKATSGAPASHSPHRTVTAPSAGTGKARQHAASKSISPRSSVNKDVQNRVSPAGKSVSKDSLTKEEHQASQDSHTLKPHAVGQEDTASAAVASDNHPLEPSNSTNQALTAGAAADPTTATDAAAVAAAGDTPANQLASEPVAAFSNSTSAEQSRAEEHAMAPASDAQLALLHEERDALAKRVAELEQQLAAAKEGHAALNSSTQHTAAASRTTDVHDVGAVPAEGGQEQEAAKHATQHGAMQDTKEKMDDKDTMALVQQAVYAERMRIVMHLLSVGMTPSALVTLLSPLGTDTTAAASTTGTLPATSSVATCPSVKAPMPSRAARTHTGSGGSTPADASQAGAMCIESTQHTSSIAADSTGPVVSQDPPVSTPVAGLLEQGMQARSDNGPTAAVSAAVKEGISSTPEKSCTDATSSTAVVGSMPAPKTAAEVAAAVRATGAQPPASNSKAAAASSTGMTSALQTPTRPRTAAEVAAAHASARRLREQQQQQAAAGPASQLSELDILECLNQICRPVLPTAMLNPAAAMPGPVSLPTWDMFRNHSTPEDLSGVTPLLGRSFTGAAPSFLSVDAGALDLRGSFGQPSNQQDQGEKVAPSVLVEDSNGLERAPTLAMGCGLDSIAAAVEAGGLPACKALLTVATSGGPVMAQNEANQQPGSSATLPDCGDISLMLAMSDDDDDELPDLAAALAKECSKPPSGMPHKASRASNLPPRPNVQLRRSVDVPLSSYAASMSPATQDLPPLRSTSSANSASSVSSPFAFPSAPAPVHSPSLPGSHNSGFMSAAVSAPVSIPAAPGPLATVFAAPAAASAAWAGSKPQDTALTTHSTSPGLDVANMWSVPGGLLGGLRPSAFNPSSRLSVMSKPDATGVPDVLAAGLRSEPGPSRGTGSWLDSGPTEPTSAYAAWLEPPINLTAASMPEGALWNSVSGALKTPSTDGNVDADVGLGLGRGTGWLACNSGASWSITAPARADTNDAASASTGVHKPVGAWFAALRCSAPSSSKPAGNSVLIRDSETAPLVSVHGFQSEASAISTSSRASPSGSAKPSLPVTPRGGLSSAVLPRAGSIAAVTPQAARDVRADAAAGLSTSDAEVDPSVMMACRSGVVSPFGTSPMTQPGSSPLHAVEAALSRVHAPLAAEAPAGPAEQSQQALQRPYSPTRHIAMFQADADPLSCVRKDFASERSGELNSRHSMDGRVEQHAKQNAWSGVASWSPRRNSGSSAASAQVPNPGVGLASFRSPWGANPASLAATQARDLLLGAAGGNSKDSNAADAWGSSLQPPGSMLAVNGACYRRSTGSSSPGAASSNHVRHKSDASWLPGNATALVTSRERPQPPLHLPDCL